MNWSEIYRTQYIEPHLVIERRDGQPITCEWDVLQTIKNEIVGEDFWAVEIYPAEEHVVNEVNRRHLWIIPASRIADYDLSRRG